jgi:hypothetical protein
MKEGLLGDTLQVSIEERHSGVRHDAPSLGSGQQAVNIAITQSTLANRTY